VVLILPQSTALATNHLHRSIMAPTKKEKPEMSAFERKRLENIAANQAMLKDLSTTAQKIVPKPPPKPKSVAPRKKAAPVKREEPRPTRTSSRLAGIEADSETAKRKAEVEYEFAKEVSKAKKQRIEGDLNFNDVIVEGKNWKKGDDFLSGVMRGAIPNLRTFTEDDIKETTDEGLKALREKMSGLELYEGYEPNRKHPIALPAAPVLIMFRNQNHPRTNIRTRISSNSRKASYICWR
jgi:hypothetical protein